MKKKILVGYDEYDLTQKKWLKTRGIGGSDLAAIMQESKWQTYNTVYNRLIGKESNKKDLSNNSRVQEGVKLEPLIRNMWQVENPDKNLIAPPKNGNWVFVSKKNIQMTVSPDGLLLKDDRYVGGLEIKDVEVRSKVELEKWRSGYLPPQYFYQCMQYMIVINTLDYVVLHARIKIYNYDKFDHVEEYDYIYNRSTFKSKLEKIEYIETQFIERFVNKNERPNANYLRLIEKDYNLWKKSKKAM